MLALILTFAAVAATASATGYTEGREYVYSYKGQIYTGYPRIKPQSSGYAFQAKIIIQPHGDYAVVKVDDVNHAQFNGEFEDVRKHPHNYHPLPAQAEFLSRPFKVYRKNGIVSQLEVTKGEPSFSVNLKKGLVSLFNLNFDEAEATPSTEDNDIQKPDPDRHYYKVYEKGLLGDCETAYVIGHHPYHKTPQNNIVLNVTKVRNYHKCNSYPNQVYGVFHGYSCGKAEHEKPHTLHGDASYRYSIRGYRHHYVIEKIVTVGEMAYTPYPVEGQTVSTKLNRYLRLIEERDVSTELDMGADTDSYNSLEYEFDFQKNFKDPVDLKKPHYIFHLTGRKVPVDTIKTQFEELTQMYSDDTYQEKIKEKEFPTKFIEILRSVGSIGYQDIETLFQTYADIPKTGATSEQKTNRNLFIDILVNTGTNPAILFGKYLVENKKVSAQEAAYFFSQLPLHTKEASETLFDAIQEMCEHENVRKHQSTYVTCLLSFSTLVGERCVSRYHPDDAPTTSAHYCHPEDAVKYFQAVASQYQPSKVASLRMAYMKAAGNIGLREILPYLKPYIEGSQGDNYFRANAIYSVVAVGFRFPDKVKDLLVPLLFNHTENYELRIAALNVLLMYRPALYELEGMARALKHDPDDQLKSYMYSRLKYMVNSTHPCDRKSSKDAHYALRILEKDKEAFEKYDYSYSKYSYFGGYDHDYDYGGSTTFSYLASDTGYIPRAMYLGLEDYIGGKSLYGLALGFKQNGLEKFLDKLIGPGGSFGRRSVFDLFKKRAKRDAGGVEKELNEIKSKINIPVIDYKPIHGEFFFKTMGRQHSFFHFDDKTFESFFKEGRFTIPNLPAMLQKIPEYRYQRYLLAVDRMYVVPSESGVPIVFDYKMALHYYHHNHETSFRVEPGFFAEDRQGKWPDHVKFETDGHLALDKQLLASMGVVIPFDQVIFGAGINRCSTLSLPLKIKMDLDEKEKSLTTKWTPVAPHQVYHFEYQPYTFVDSYANGVPQTLEPGFLPVRRQSTKHLQEKYLHDALGVGFDVHAEYENNFNDKGSWLKFLMEKDYREKFYYIFTNPHFEPYIIDVQFSHADSADTKEVETTFKYRYFDSEHSQPEFATEGFEDYKISAVDEGRGPFCTCELEAQIVGSGGSRERKAQAIFSWTRDLKRTHHKLNFYYDRTPFTSKETQNLKICSSAFLKYPRYDLVKIAGLDTKGMDHTVDAEITTRFGKDCKTHQRFTVRGQAFTTEQQREMESAREEPDTPEHHNSYAHAYQGCLKERQRGINYGENCMKYFEIITTVHGYHFYGRYENLSERFMNMTNRFSEWMKFAGFPYADHAYPVQNPENEFHIHANFSECIPIGDIRIARRYRNSHYTNVYVPKYKGLRSFPEFEDIHVKNSFVETRCKLEGDNVLTFDRYEYTLPPIDCYKVIAKDCSPNEFFTVLGTKITHPKYHKAVKVFIGGHKVEALPVSDESDIILRVDGKRVPLDSEHPYIHRETEGDVSFYLAQRDFYYALHSEKYGLIVEYDGHNVIVQVSPFYRSKICGLCGNYNGQKYDGYETSEGCYYEDEKAYAYAYAIPTDTCQVPQFQPKCPVEGGFGCTKLRTKVIELGGAKPQTCFSTEPVAECATSCKASSTSSKNLSFHCLPAKDDSTKALVRQQPHRVLHEVRRKSKDHESEVQVPDACLKVPQ